MKTPSCHDVLIIGGGPAGLSAALLLGRCLRDVIICDAGRPRNERSLAMHGYLGLDGIAPTAFYNQARTQLGAYNTVKTIQGTIVDVVHEDSDFISHDSEGRKWRSRVVLIATGLIDRMPDVPDLNRYYGVSIHHCPYCDGWENRGKRIGVVGTDAAALDLASELLLWTPRVTLFTNEDEGGVPLGQFAEAPIEVVRGKIRALNGNEAQLSSVLLADGEVACDALFFSPDQAQHSALATRLGCHVEDDTIHCDDQGCTAVCGLFAAGNATNGIQMAIVAAAEGVKAGAAINTWLSDSQTSTSGPIQP